MKVNGLKNRVKVFSLTDLDSLPIDRQAQFVQMTDFTLAYTGRIGATKERSLTTFGMTGYFVNCWERIGGGKDAPILSPSAV